MVKTKKYTLLLSALQFAYWSLAFITDGVYAGMLRSLGYGEAFIGLTLTVTGLAGLLFQPISGYIADRTSKFRIISAVSYILMGGIIPMLLAAPSSKTVVYAYALFGGGFTKVTAGLIDSWINKMSGGEIDIDFGRIRSVGSISYAVMAVLLGRLFDRLGYGMTLWASIPLMAVGVVCSLLMDDPENSTEKGPRIGETFSYLIHNKEYLVFLVCMMLMNITTQSFFAFFALLVEDAGGTVGTLGIEYFIMAFLEFWVVRANTFLIRKVGCGKLAGLGMVGNFIKSICYSLAGSPSQLYACSVTHCCSFALIVPTSPVYQNTVVEKKYLATAQQLLQTCCTSLIPFLMSSVFGNIAQDIGSAAMIRMFSFPALAGGLFFLMTLRKKNTD